MKKKNSPILSEEEKAAIIYRWRFSKLNSIAEIALEFNVSQNQIHQVINKHLATKIPS